MTSGHLKNRQKDSLHPAYEQVVCSFCNSRSSAYKTYYDDAGDIWQIACFSCGRVVSADRTGQHVKQLRHKCLARYVLG